MNALALAALASLVLAVSEPSQTPPPTPLPIAVNKQQESHYAEAASSTTEPPIISPTEKHDSVNKQRPDRDKESNRLIIRFTRILAFAAIVQLVVMGIQAMFMHLTRRSFEKGERARLFTDNFVFSGFHPGEKEIVVKYSVHNTGRTGADVYEQNVSFADEFSDNDRLPEIPPYTDGTPAHFTVAAGRNFGLRAKIEKSVMPNFSEIATGKRSLYILGYLKYRDAFGKSHESRYAMRWRNSESFTVIDVPGYNIDT